MIKLYWITRQIFYHPLHDDTVREPCCPHKERYRYICANAPFNPNQSTLLPNNRERDHTDYCDFASPYIRMSASLFRSWVRSIVMFVCFVWPFDISKTTRPNITKFLCILASVLCRRCDILCTSGFVDDVTFSHDGLYGASRAFVSGDSVTAENI